MNRIFPLRLNAQLARGRWANPARHRWAKLAGLACAALLATGVAATADYNAGLQAFNSGDFKVAMKEWAAPAKGGDAQAQHGMGLIYETGRGLDKPDIKEAIRWYEASAKQDYAPALNNLAMLYSSGPRRRQGPEQGDPALEAGGGEEQYDRRVQPRDPVHAG